VVLRFKMSSQYPLAPPAALEVASSKGLSDNKLQELAWGLRKKAEEHVGEVMVTELAMAAAQWLTDHNKPTFASFYEEMQVKQLSVFLNLNFE